MSNIQKSIAILGASVLAAGVSQAQLITTQEDGYFSAAYWQANLGSLNLNPAGNLNGTVPLPGSPSFAAGGTFTGAGLPFLGGGEIDVVWFAETAGWTMSDLYLSDISGSTLIVDNAVAPANPKFGASELYTVAAGMDFTVDPQLGANFDLLDGSSPTRFFWATYTDSLPGYDYTYYIFGVEDRVAGADNDYTDLLFAVGFREQNQLTVPEPSTYGLLGAALIGALLVRRKLTKKVA